MSNTNGLKKYTAEELIGMMTNRIHKYSKERSKMTEEEIQESRAKLASAAYMLTEGPVRTIRLKATNLELIYEETLASEWESLYNGFRKDNSDSQSKELANKLVKKAPKVLGTKKEWKNAEDDYYNLDRIVRSANQVLNSMKKGS